MTFGRKEKVETYRKVHFGRPISQWPQLKKVSFQRWTNRCTCATKAIFTHWWRSHRPQKTWIQSSNKSALHHWWLAVQGFGSDLWMKQGHFVKPQAKMLPRSMMAVAIKKTSDVPLSRGTSSLQSQNLQIAWDVQSQLVTFQLNHREPEIVGLSQSRYEEVVYLTPCIKKINHYMNGSLITLKCSFHGHPNLLWWTGDDCSPMVEGLHKTSLLEKSLRHL